MAVNYYLASKLDKSGDAAIRISIVIMGKRFLTNTGMKIAPAKWNAAKQQVKHGCSNSKGITYTTINKKLLQYSEHFAQYENDCIMKGRTIDANNLRYELSMLTNNHPNTPIANKVAQGFWGQYDSFVVEMGRRNDWTAATHQKFRALKRHLQEFDEKLNFDKLNEHGLADLLAFFRVQCNMRNTTISKQLGFVKWFLRWAEKKGYNNERAYLTFAPRLKAAKKQVIFLDWDELMRVYHYEIPANGTIVSLTTAAGKGYEKVLHDASALAKTRDIFCFCCFTGLRFSDAVNLRRSNIANDSITITTVKTADTITIELNKYAHAILAKYTSLPDDKALPSITNQRMNAYLKELAEFCGINKLVTQTYYRGNTRYDETQPKYELIGTHTGRRTFICNALMLGISPQVIMKWTGHSDYKAMKPYIDITDAAKAQAMDLFNAR